MGLSREEDVRGEEGVRGEVQTRCPWFPQVDPNHLVGPSHSPLLGTIPDALSAIGHLGYVALHANVLTGTIPNFSALVVTYFDVANNQLTGDSLFSWWYRVTIGCTVWCLAYYQPPFVQFVLLLHSTR